MDCSSILGGCNGGQPLFGYGFMMSKGVMNASDDPYTAKDAACETTSGLAVTYVANVSSPIPNCLIDCSSQVHPRMLQQRKSMCAAPQGEGLILITYARAVRPS